MTPRVIAAILGLAAGVWALWSVATGPSGDIGLGPVTMTIIWAAPISAIAGGLIVWRARIPGAALFVISATLMQAVFGTQVEGVVLTLMTGVAAVLAFLPAGRL